MLLQEITDLGKPPLLSLTAIEQALEEQRERETALWQVIRRREQERDVLLQEVEALEQGRIVLPEEVNGFLAALRGQAIQFQLVADYVQVRDPRWLRAVEGILGGERFTVVVHDPALRLRAKRLAEQRHYPYWVSHPQKPVSISSTPAGSLWEVVEVTDEHVAGWVAERLSHIRRVKTVEEGDLISSREGVVTVTPLATDRNDVAGAASTRNGLCVGKRRELHVYKKFRRNWRGFVHFWIKRTDAYQTCNSGFALCGSKSKGRVNSRNCLLKSRRMQRCKQTLRMYKQKQMRYVQSTSGSNIRKRNGQNAAISLCVWSKRSRVKKTSIKHG